MTPRNWANEYRCISGTIARLASAWNDGDEAGYASHFTDDAVYLAASGERYKGKAQIRTGYGWLFATSLRGSRISLDVESIRSWSPAIAFVTVRVRLEAPDDAADCRHALIRSSVVMVLTMGDWRVAALHGTRVADDSCGPRRPPSMWTGQIGS
ncbi:SgcJ/EcaC family oxidoreductase [Bradyrhizobium oropedii]|uniref:SgcJ/EcaC family oxidoreductase n=1 Tax=Bradyrhizobium oropedii TaxID=1571201 RepID=UPI0030844D81